MKNIVLFHLESLNNLFYLMHPELFPNLRKIAKDGYSFKNYYSTATSTFMVITDLFFQDTKQFESSECLEDLSSVHPSKKSFVDSLKSYSLNYLAIGKDVYFSSGEGEAIANKISTSFHYLHLDSPLSLETEVNKVINSCNSFFLFIEDNESQIGEMKTFEGMQNKSSYELYKYRYKKLDETVGRIIKILQDCNLYDMTVIMLYGDHGDELYWHNLREGYTHAIEPYSDMIYCPLIIRGSNVDLSDKVNQLVSTSQLGDLLLYSAGYNKTFSNPLFVFSRNLFKNQRLCLDRFNKSYSVTDGNYLLIVSHFGLEMYMNSIDYMSKCNILNFFILKGSKIVYNKTFDALISSHYKSFINEETIAEIFYEFDLLFLKLYEYVTCLFEDAPHGMNFEHINYSDNYITKKRFLKMRFLKNLIKVVIKKLIR